MRRRIVLLVAAALLLGLLSGCKQDGGGAPGVYQEAEAFYKLSADDLVAEAIRRFDALEGWSFSVATTMDSGFFYGNEPQVAYQATGALIKASLTTHGSVSYRPAIEEYPTEVYTRSGVDGEEELLEFAMHLYSKRDEVGEWNWMFGKNSLLSEATEDDLLPSPQAGYGFVQRLPVHARGRDILYFADNIGRAFSAGRDFHRMESGSVNGRRAVRFEGTVSGEALEHLLGYTGLAGNFFVEADDAPSREGMPISLWIDAETVLPLRIELDATELMQREIQEPALKARMMHETDPDKLEKLTEYWDTIAVYLQGSQRIDITPELPVIEIPAEIDAGMRDAEIKN